MGAEVGDGDDGIGFGGGFADAATKVAEVLFLGKLGEALEAHVEDGDDAFASAEGWAEEVGEVVDVGLACEEVERWPPYVAPKPLEDGTGEEPPRDGLCPRDVDNAAVAEVEIKQTKRVLRRKNCEEFFGQDACITTDAGALGYGGLIIHANTHVGSVAQNAVGDKGGRGLDLRGQGGARRGEGRKRGCGKNYTPSVLL